MQGQLKSEGDQVAAGVQRGVDVNERDKTGSCAVHWMAAHGVWEELRQVGAQCLLIIQLLIILLLQLLTVQGVDVGPRNHWGSSPLHLAAKQSRGDWWWW